MNALNVKSKIVLMPVTEEESKRYTSFASIYALYKNDKTGDIEIAIPDLGKYNLGEDNMEEYNNAERKGLFYRGGKELAMEAFSIKDRPVYLVETDNARTVREYSSLNGVDVSLKDVLKGKFKIGENKKAKVKGKH